MITVYESRLPDIHETLHASMRRLTVVGQHFHSNMTHKGEVAHE